jgi:hypothetical protein
MLAHPYWQVHMVAMQNYVTGAVVAVLVCTPVPAEARRTDASGRNAKRCSVLIDRKFDLPIEECLKLRGLLVSYDGSLGVTIVSGDEYVLNPALLRNGMRLCLGETAAGALKEGSNRDPGGNMLFGVIECSLKYIDYMDRRHQ